MTNRSQSARRSVGISSRSRGFTIVELMIAGVIIAVLTAVAYLQFKPLMMEGKAPGVARDLQAASSKIAASRQGTGATPFAAPTAVTIAELGSMLRNSVFDVTGTPATAVSHSLGTGAVAPAVTIGPVDIGGGAGSGFTILLAGVEPAACPSLVKSLSVAAVGIQVGAGAAVTTTGVGANVRAIGAAFLPNIAQTACDAAATVDIALVFR